MRLRKLTIQNWRNLGQVRLECRGRRQFLVGANGQGKTSVLEAAGFLTALRSFRASDPRLLIAHGREEAALACELEHERYGETTVTIRLRAGAREVWCDQERITRLADHVGRFPTVVFSSQDLLLVRGAPALRRRWLDLTLASMDGDYLRVLQGYHRALAARNLLLKTGGNEAEVAAFETQLAPAGAQLVARRTEGVAALGEHLGATYARIAPAGEPAGLAYTPDVAETAAEALAARWADGRPRDRLARTTQRGPHRDDVEFVLAGWPAREVASEGQQRNLVLALRLAQAAWYRTRADIRPVLLADDVLGELDPERRHRFWATLDDGQQVIATGTSLPEDAAHGGWQVLRMTAGQVAEEGAPDAP